MKEYQPIYDAVSLQFSSASWAIDSIKQEFLCTAQEMRRPSVLYKPSLNIDGDQWCALLGNDLQSGVAGFGDTPAIAMEAFDSAFATLVLSKGTSDADL